MTDEELAKATAQAKRVEELSEALTDAYGWLEYENAYMGPHETKVYERLMGKIRQALEGSAKA